ncbi:TAF RNA polymerase I subunit A [Quillaja saponaria]|uniref:TAF RNA polymerase I subunit A n=1 Tax=Quillaja saponaria TaxID=32244 RepID=A0AAD7QI13_QUISA|nr:TAF RNA polymerase I subunit A [Quillaja saponaria]
MDSPMSEFQVEEPEYSDKDTKLRKRKLNKLIDDSHVSLRSKLIKRIILSLTKPSYVLGKGPKAFRSENRARLSYLLRRLVVQQNWTEASGVLSRYLQGTIKDKSPTKNRFKYSILLELLKHIDNNHINTARIKNIYDVWMRKNGSMKDWPIKDRYVVHSEFILFCLMQGNVDEAHQAALCLKQENEVGSDPMSNMVIGLTFYELWYTCIPKELQWRDSDLLGSHSPEHSDMAGTRFNNQVGNSEWCNTVKSHIIDTPYKHNSDTSVMNDKQISMHGDIDHNVEVRMEVDVSEEREKHLQNFQPQGFYMNSDENTDNGDTLFNHEHHMQNASFLSALGNLDSWLLPLQLRHQSNSFEDLIYLHRELLNDHYKDAVKHLQLALHSTPPVLAVLLPLIQLLLIGGHVNDALNELEKLCPNSVTALPNRLKATLLDHFDPNNSHILSCCFEDILKKDPTCGDSLAKLVKLHQNGDYSLESLMEYIASHLDATYAEYNTWKEFASCFLKLYHSEEDRMSFCHSEDEDDKQYSSCCNRTPEIFIEGKSGKAWRLRCRWWLTRHFRNDMIVSEIAAGDLQLLTYKAACASHMYGEEFDYVVKAYSHVKKENDRELLLFLEMHMQNSIGFYLGTKH